MTSCVGYADDADSNPSDGKLRPREQIIWSGTFRNDRPWTPTAFEMTVTTAVFGFALRYMFASNPESAHSLAIASFGPITFLLLVFIYPLREPERAFIFRGFPWHGRRDPDIVLNQPTQLCSSNIYFAEKTIRTSKKPRRHPDGFSNIRVAEAEAVHDQLRKIQRRAIP